ncbi:hypothetical protein BD310DRAFT_454817 [Dichomitus squalens]|uniref:Uncharacterized protein n=1 Tax=Dichomitus squalens TaxID=114155 RepID=A0A4Q9PVK4_9APHY|nr:hypothetical protein BD310DRAFT_454817 [Dichomitus squalens]
MPSDMQARIDYGFDKALAIVGIDAQLLGLWSWICVCRAIPPQEVRRWRQQGRLIEGVKTVFEAVPLSQRGVYYAWFLQYQWLLDGTPHDESIASKNFAALVDNMLIAAWRFTGGSSNDTAAKICQEMNALPLTRRAYYDLYSVLICGSSPHPIRTLWVDFGFVAAMNGVEEDELRAKYMQLIEVCSFGEFCTAYESSSIPALFERYGVSVSHYRLFLDVMAGTPSDNKSVWDLKQYIDILASPVPEHVDHPPEPFLIAFVDYGFANCKDPDDSKLLDDLYKKLFWDSLVDPLELHEARVRGRLLEYVKKFKFVKYSPHAAKYSRLLKSRHSVSVLA